MLQSQFPPPRLLVVSNKMNIHKKNQEPLCVLYSGLATIQGTVSCLKATYMKEKRILLAKTSSGQLRTEDRYLSS